MSLLHRDARREPLAELSRFRGEFYSCLTARSDGLFELADAVLCGDGPVRSLAELSLVGEHRRGHGGLYAVVARGWVDTARLRQALAAVPLPRAADGRLVLAIDITCWLRPDAHTSPERILCHTYGRGKDQHIPVPGWPYSIICALEPGRSSWTAPMPDRQESTLLLRWARDTGLAANSRQEQHLAAMRLEVLAQGALPQGGAEDVVLTAQWAAFVCWVDDHIDRRGLGTVPGELEQFTASLRQVFATGGEISTGTAPQAVVLARLWGRTAPGMSARWRRRFAADYTDFLDACEAEAALRRAGVRLPLAHYLRLRRRTITLLPMLDVLERTGQASLPEVVWAGERLRDLRWAVADVAGWANDVASVGDDAADGQDNLVAILAREGDCSPRAARCRAAAMIEERRAEFAATATALRADLAKVSEGREELERYVDLLERFMAATLRWLSVTGRFTPGTSAPASVARALTTRPIAPDSPDGADDRSIPTTPRQRP
ncbi:transposase (plasmid) [Streptomyces sp. NBC_01426]